MKEREFRRLLALHGVPWRCPDCGRAIWLEADGSYRKCRHGLEAGDATITVGKPRDSQSSSS